MPDFYARRNCAISAKLNGKSPKYKHSDSSEDFRAYNVAYIL
jgi:hypothetical protein